MDEETEKTKSVKDGSPAKETERTKSVKEASPGKEAPQEAPEAPQEASEAPREAPEAPREAPDEPPPLPTSAPPVPSADVKYEKVEPSMLDNLPSHQKHIMERLEGIRASKQRILMTLRGLKENVKEGELPNKELMAKMIASYDALNAQEEQYVQLMQQIVSIRENAAEDVQHENAKIGENAPLEGKGKESAVKEKDDDASNDKTSKEEEADNGVDELNGELTKLGVVKGKAVAASVMNDKLMETLQLHRDKKAALDELRRREKECQVGAANEALQQVEMARLKVASEQEQVERKRKTLERLRREAQRRGIKLGPGSASEPDIVVEPQPEPKSITEAKLRAKLQAKKKQTAELENDNGPPVPDDLAPAERIPPILENEQAKAEQQQQQQQQEQVQKGTGEVDGSSGAAGKKKKKGKKGREQQQQQPKKQSDAINSSIREKLASIAARKERMREIRAQLVRPVARPTADMDETFLNAQQQLKSIIEMRKQLELLHEKGEELPEETAQLLERQLEAEENGTKQSEAAAAAAASDAPTAARPDSESPFEESSQVVEAARNNFLKAMAQKTGSGTGMVDTHIGIVQDDLSAGYRLTAADSQRLKNMEQALQEQRQLLETIASRSCQHRSPSLSAVVSCQAKAAALRKCFLSAAPQLLTRLGNILLDLAKGQVVPELDTVLTRLLQSTDEERLSGEADERRSEASNGSREVASAESEPPEATELVKLIRADSATRFERELSRELTPEEASKLEQAKRQLCSGKAKLRKQQTLEKVRSRTEMADDHQQQQQQQQQKLDVEHVKGLESDICKIIDGIVPWIRERGEVVADDESMRQLRDEILEQASRVCFPEGGAAPSDLFRSQLSTIVDGTLSQYVGSKVGEVREELVFDISEILYNELAFFQLMYNINNLVP